MPRSTHGHTRSVDGKTVQSPTYQSYRSMLDRCYREKHPRFHRYGGRDLHGSGEPIIVCARWRFGEGDLSGFECFLADMGVRPDDMTLDRKHVDDDYEPGKCQWATVKDQNNNKSNTHFITLDGETMSLSKWVDRLDKRVHYAKILRRIWAGADPAEALRAHYATGRQK